MFNKHDLKKNAFMLTGSFAKRGYDWWWHNFTARNEATGEEKSFFVEFFIINPKLTEHKEEPILGQTEENQKNHIYPSYLMVKCGCWGKDARQFHRFFPLSKVRIKKGASYQVEAEDCFASETTLKGHVSLSKEEVERHPEYMSAAGDMAFDLKLEKDIAWNVGYGTCGLFRFLKAFEMYWHGEGIKTFVTGKVILDGQTYVVNRDTSYGYADKNWGRAFTSPWVWLSSWDLYSEKEKRVLTNSAFDIGGGRPKAFGIPFSRKLLGGLYLEGKCYEFNFSKFWTGSKTIFSSTQDDKEITWHVEQIASGYKLVSDITCDRKDMLLVQYEEPDGTHRHNNLYNGGTGKGILKLYKKVKKEWVLQDTLIAGHIGCEYGEIGPKK